MKTNSSLACLFFTGILCVTQALAQNHSRSYAFTAPEGNLLPNWSFEVEDDFWIDQPDAPGVDEVNVRAPGLDNVKEGPKSGGFIAQVRYHGASEALRDLSSVPFHLIPGKAYTLSFYYQSKEKAATDWSAAPELDCLVLGSNTSVLLDGPALTPSATWKLYTWSFTAPAGLQDAVLSLFHIGTVSDGVILSADDVVLEEGTVDAASEAAERGLHGETVSFEDGLGRKHQVFNKVEENQFIANATGFNANADPESTFLPLPAAAPNGFANAGLISDVNGLARSDYSGINGKGRPDAGGFPFSQQVMPQFPAAWITENSSQGKTWALGNGHTMKKGYFLSDALQPPTGDPSVPSNLAHCANLSGCLYEVAWEQDKNGKVSFTYTDRFGQVVRKARRFMNGSTVSFAYTDYEYYPNGALKSKRTPLDVADSRHPNTYSTVTEFNSQGRAVSSKTPDAGLTRNWYNRAGQIRYTQSESQRQDDHYTYYDYDSQGRLISEGTDKFSFATNPMTQDLADMASAVGEDKRERIGYIYDDFSTLKRRMGLGIDQLGVQGIPDVGPGARGHLVCKYALNPEVSSFLPNPQDRLVAEFFTSFDAQGRVLTAYKYHGVTRAADFMNPRATFSYYPDGKTSSFSFKPTQQTSDEVGEHFYYDRLGRIEAVRDEGENRLGDFEYQDWGPLKSTFLGGTGTTRGTRVDQDYHIQGYLKQISATQLFANKSIFRQSLGYEGKSYPNAAVPNPTQPQFDGTISQEMEKFTGEVPSRLIMHALHYDDLGRMTQDSGYQTTANPLTASEDVDWTLVSFVPNGPTSGFFGFDLNGRITSQRSGGVDLAEAGQYFYKTSTNKLDAVAGKVFPGPTRDMSAANTFRYDADGNMIEDISKTQGGDPTKTFRLSYNWNNMPFKMTIGTQEQYTLYDADGKRAVRIDRFTTDADVNEIGHYWIINGQDFGEARENPGDALVISEVYPMTTPNGNVLGRRWRQDMTPLYTPEFFIKNHQGSVMRTVKNDGTYKTTDGSVLVNDFSDYGNPRPLVAGTGTKRLSQGFTGKEYDGTFNRLTYYGARFFDPELGIWMSPDAAAQLHSPYGYGSSPVMYVDKDGNFLFLVPLLLGGAINLAANWDKVGSVWQGLGYFALGAGQAAASVYGGPLGAVLAGTAGGALGAALGGGGIPEMAAGAVSGYFGAAVGAGIAPLIGNAMGGMSAKVFGKYGANRLLDRAATAATVGAISGFVGGGIGAMVGNNGDMGRVLHGALSGAINGAAAGAVTAMAIHTAANIADYRNPFTGARAWPPNNGFGSFGEAETRSGTWDRYGEPYPGSKSDPGSQFLAPAGTSFEERALPPGSEKEPVCTFEIVKPVPTEVGPAAEAFGQPGGGQQIRVIPDIQTWIGKSHIIRVVPPTPPVPTIEIINSEANWTPKKN